MVLGKVRLAEACRLEELGKFQAKGNHQEATKGWDNVAHNGPMLRDRWKLEDDGSDLWEELAGPGQWSDT